MLQLSLLWVRRILFAFKLIFLFIAAELTQSEGIEHQFEVEEMDDETYTGLLIYKPWGDYSKMPMMTC